MISVISFVLLFGGLTLLIFKEQVTLNLLPCMFVCLSLSLSLTTFSVHNNWQTETYHKSNHNPPQKAAFNSQRLCLNVNIPNPSV